MTRLKKFAIALLLVAIANIGFLIYLVASSEKTPTPKPDPFPPHGPPKPNPKPDRDPLIEKFMPVFYLYKKECYFPINVDDYLAGSTLVDLSVQPQSPLKKSPTQEVLYNMRAHLTGNQFSFETDDPKILYGTKNVSDVPIYSNVIKVGSETYINYVAFFGFNGWYAWRNPFVDRNHYRCQGAHTSDIEGVIVNLDSSGKLKRILYARHGSDEQEWVDAKNIEMEDGHPVVYIAWRGHGMYQKAGKWVRPKVPFVRDQIPDITGKDIRWFPKYYVILRTPGEEQFVPFRSGIIVYKGDMGFHPNEEDSTGIQCGHMECPDTGGQMDWLIIDQNDCSFDAWPCLKGWPLYRQFNQDSATDGFGAKSYLVTPQNEQSGNQLAKWSPA